MNSEGFRRSSYCSGGNCVEVEGAFIRSSFCADNQCVEVAPSSDVVRLRDSKRPDTEPFIFTAAEWRAFIAGAKAGEFDV